MRFSAVRTQSPATGVNEPPAPADHGPACSCLVTAISGNATMRHGIDARLATLTTLAKAGEVSWCSGEDWIQGGA